MPLIAANNLYAPPALQGMVTQQVDYTRQPLSPDVSTLFRIAGSARYHFEAVPSRMEGSRVEQIRDYDLPPLVASTVVRTRYKIVKPMPPVEFDQDELPL